MSGSTWHDMRGSCARGLERGIWAVALAEDLELGCQLLDGDSGRDLIIIDGNERMEYDFEVYSGT
jgi:hypothetical protein